MEANRYVRESEAVLDAGKHTFLRLDHICTRRIMGRNAIVATTAPLTKFDGAP